MEHRKRVTRPIGKQTTPSLPSYDNKAGSTSNKSSRKFGKRETIVTLLKFHLISASNLPLTMLIITITFSLYSFLSHHYFLSVSIAEASTTSTHRILHHVIPEGVKLEKKEVPSHFLPQRPRTIGYFFENSSSDSFIGSERMDPNVVKLYKTHVTIDIPKDEYKRIKMLDDSDEYKHHGVDPFETEECVAQYDWQLHSNPTCNHLMEQDLTNLKSYGRGKEDVRLIANGYWRDVWKVRINSNAEKAVVKTMRYEHDYTERNYDRHRRDAVGMERLTSSEYVMDIYAFCGNSGIFEYADGGAIEDSIWGRKEDEWNPKERLIVAYQVARGIADLHNFAQEGVPAIAHTDITTSQFVYVGESGLYKLNDFNRCRFLRKNTKTNEICPYYVGNNPGTFRSPEEYSYEEQSEKVDIYSMGNIFYSIVSKRWPFEEVKDQKKARRMIRKGVRPDLPQEFLDSTDPFDQAMLKAIQMCWKQDPKERATAREIERFLDSELAKHGVEKA